MILCLGFGSRLFSIDGQSYLDCVNNVSHCGHSHPHIIRAEQQQCSLLCTNTRYHYARLSSYCERLIRTFPTPEPKPILKDRTANGSDNNASNDNNDYDRRLQVVFLVNSGSEANDLALRMAHCHTHGAQGINYIIIITIVIISIAFHFNFHYHHYHL